MEQEQAWILQAQRGDQQAFGELVRAYQRPVVNLAYRMLGDLALAEDAAQEAFLRAYGHLRSYQPGRKFVNWLLAITSHYCIDQLRRRRLSWCSLERSVEGDGMDTLRSTEPTPEQAMEHKEREQRVQRMLSQLAPDDRLVVVLRYWHDGSYQEIAEMTGASEGAVKSRLFRARERMARVWQEMEAR